MVTPMDTWIMDSAIMGCHLNYCSLMFATMVNFRVPDFAGSLPFGVEISAFVERLGISPKYRYSKHMLWTIFFQHVLHRVGWSRCVPMPRNGLGGGLNISGMDADVVDDLATQASHLVRLLRGFRL
ncbi:hypothetical protein LINPERHAP2_LOCUS2843 [Linum perenne]